MIHGFYAPSASYLRVHLLGILFVHSGSTLSPSVAKNHLSCHPDLSCLSGMSSGWPFWEQLWQMGALESAG